MISDEELYRQYLSGDETGLIELMKKYGNPLTLYINGYLHDIHEAEDLMIEVFSYLFAKRPPIRDGGFRAYLYKAARHMALRHKSIRRHHFCLDDLTKEPEGGKLVDEVIRTKERNQILHLCMGELNPDYREALYLTYFEGMSYRQVAEVMGKSVKQITNIMYRGKERLRGLLEREGITNAES
ncbi:MAG: sigma-70 family RNA polymerase sigma factor [Firmicutes bacterium]|nr:sigma-70 family RNA polymerase sigma factor [Bacillota bacterium]